MVGEFYSKLEELLNKSDLKDDERKFLEQLAEFMVFLEKDVSKDPRTIHERSFLKLKEKNYLVLTKNSYMITKRNI